MPSPYRAAPPLPVLRTFEAVARLGSFTRAAEELAITQSAVSHQIRTLEQFVGAPLFHRRNPGIELTGEGRILVDGVRAGLDLILRASDRIRYPRQVGVLTVAVPMAFASWWLVPRLGRFAALHPNIEIRISTMECADLDFVRANVDVAIVTRGADEAPRANEEMLLREEIFPVCSPALLERGSGLRQPGDLARQTLLEEESAAYDESRWAPWLERLGVADEPAVSRLRFSHYGVALSAAIDGLGVALGRAPMIDCELAAGRLVRPFGDKLSLTAPDVHVLSWPEGAERDQRFLAFRDFVLDETCNCELAAGPCGDPAPQQPPDTDWVAERAARRLAASGAAVLDGAAA
jgi:DNA-binding transcriptional LysR family regulator